MRLIHGDCIEEMSKLPDNSIDFCCTDIPYGTTACKWDQVIPFEPMWNQLKRIVKDNGAIALFGSEPFASSLRMSNIKNYKYDWIWLKNKGSNFMLLKKQPWKMHELISIFYNKQTTYNPIMRELSESGKARNNRSQKGNINKINNVHGKKTNMPVTNQCGVTKGYPLNILRFNKVSNNQYKKVMVHPTQKPTPLLEYLISTYTLENETVLDFTMGSGSCGVASKNLNRNFIGIEKDDKYFNIATERINGI